MARTRLPIVGREGELSAVADFIANTAAGPESLVLEGSAGIGKTAIWAEATRPGTGQGPSRTVLSVQRVRSGLGVRRSWRPARGADAECSRRCPRSNVGHCRPPCSHPTTQSARPAAESSGWRCWACCAAQPGRPVAAGGRRRAVARHQLPQRAVVRAAPTGPTSRYGCWSRTARAAAERRAPDLGLEGERLVVGPVSVGTLQRIIAEPAGHDAVPPDADPAALRDRRQPDDVPGDGAGAAAPRRRPRGRRAAARPGGLRGAGHRAAARPRAAAHASCCCVTAALAQPTVAP